MKEAQTVTLRIYTQDDASNLVEQFCGTRHTVRLGDHLHAVAVTAQTPDAAKQLAWGRLYYYDMFFQADTAEKYASAATAHLGTSGVLNTDPSSADFLHRLVYPGHPLPSFVLPPEDLNQLRIFHGSCRKPHGIGREMLSALDDILADSAQNAAVRPQQLFLTGDQIYADDVAAPLLYALTDVGNFLLAGNKEEILPLVDVPSRMLAPGERTDAVRNMAMFSTGEAENHLLALAEFYSMYLFAWSDVLWPEDLPFSDYMLPNRHVHHQSTKQKEHEEQEYLNKVKQLQEFRSSLPQVRRVLANIATYMIFDDHDVTDDWFLDGQWCQRILASKLGERIVRNGLLAYALFQAWGNTPAQFDGPNGVALLEAVDAWRGDEADNRTTIFARTIGLPSPFNGRGTLQRSEQALQWHYTFSGPRYQMIVLDSRTQRSYQAPNAFPGLLSPRAIETQVIANTREDAEVTFIVSPTPVLGMSVVEAIQTWSRLLNKNNDSWDPEAWALDRFAFQNFLKAVAAMKRVVILSGDVHYAFGSSLQYWDRHTQATAKIINYTSSPLHNEGTSIQIAVLARGYPEIYRMEGRGEMPAVNFFAWDGSTKVLYKILQLIKSRPYKLWWAVQMFLNLRRSSRAIILPAQGWPRGAFDTIPPDRSYQLHYLHDRWYCPIVQKLDTPDKAAPAFQHLPAALPEGAYSLKQRVAKGQQLLEHEVAVLEKDRAFIADIMLHHQKWLSHLESGMLIVGYANIGEISLQWTQNKKEAIQRLWWCHPDNPAQHTLGTEFRELLDLPEFSAAPPLP